MAMIDTQRDVTVVRIVYDGPPLSGKTTSIKALGTILGHQAYSFPQQAENIPPYFEWMEYIGGLFRGYSLCCQIISVPSQPFLQNYRHFLLHTADAVIFVIDASQHETGTALAYFNELQNLLSQPAEDAPIKIVIQVNKQDKPHCLSLEHLKTHFHPSPDIKFVESTATLGKGVREAFVLAVHFAAERAGKLMTTGKLNKGKPEVRCGEELLTQLQDTCPPPTLSAQEYADEYSLLDNEPLPPVLTQTQDDPHVAERTHSIAIPKLLLTPNLPAQWFWPPLRGRHVLNDISKLAPSVPRQQDKVWIVDVEHTWRCFSESQWQYITLEQARAALRLHISTHLHCTPILSEQRGIALVQEALHSWRLWQIVHREPTLAERLAQTLQEKQIDKCVLDLLKWAHCYITFLQQCRPYLFHLKLNLESLGLVTDQQLLYLGYIEAMPSPGSPMDTEAAVVEALKHAFSPPIMRALPSLRVAEIANTLKELDSGESSLLIEALLPLFIS
jgi:hypothetical protein